MELDSNLSENEAFCVLPFVHMNTTTGGLYRYCCLMDTPALDQNGKPITLHQHTLNDAWNSSEIREIRLKMLKGEKVKQCKKCYYEESHGSRSLRKDYTDNWLKNKTALVQERVSEAAQNSGALSQKPVFVELKFGNLCNIKCRMCSPFDSSMVQKEYEKISLSNPDFDKLWSHRHNVLFNENVKLSELSEWHKAEGKLEQFFEIIPILEKIHFAGGEPTLHTEFYDFLNKAVELDCAKNIELSFNTNLTQVREDLLLLMKKFKNVIVHASIDGLNAVQEYIRYPSKWEQISANLEKVAKIQGPVRLTVSPTIQLFNVFSIIDLFKYLDELNNRYSQTISVTPGILDNPDYFDFRILPIETRILAANKWREYASTITTNNWFKDRLLTIASVIEDRTMQIDYDKIKKFYTVTFAVDEERKQDFTKLFPELHNALVEALKRDPKLNASTMGNTVRLIKDNKFYDHRPETIIARSLNTYKGWNCSVGVNGLFIDWSGEIYPGTCLIAPEYSFGNITKDFKLSDQWRVCNREHCHCNLEISMPKYSPESNFETANQTLMLPIHRSANPIYVADAVVPALAWDRSSKFIMWALGRRCNYSCSYCDDHAHSKTEPFFKREDLFKTVDSLQEQFSKGKMIRYAFSGGEPTLHPDFMDLVKKIHNLGHLIGITSNGSRNAEYYVEMMTYATICFSLHFEFLRKDKFLNTIEKIIADKKVNIHTAKRWVDVRFMIKPNGFKEAKEFLNQLKTIDGFDQYIYYSFVPIRTANTEKLMNYTPEELDLIQKEMTT